MISISLRIDDVELRAKQLMHILHSTGDVNQYMRHMNEWQQRYKAASEQLKITLARDIAPTPTT